MGASLSPAVPTDPNGFVAAARAAIIRWHRIHDTLWIVGCTVLAFFFGWAGYLFAVERDTVTALGLGAIVMILLGFGYFRLRKLRAALSPVTHPMTVEVARFGDPSTVEKDLNGDLAQFAAAPLPLNLGRRWLVHLATGDVTMRRLEDLVWVYTTITTHRYGGIPIKRVYRVNAADRRGQLAWLPVPKTMVDPAMELLARHAPWIILGHSAELEKAWSQNAGAVIAEVDARRARSG